MSVLSIEKREAVIFCLREGMGIRETSRSTGVHTTTVMNIANDIGGPPRSKGYRPEKKAIPSPAAVYRDEVEAFAARRDVLRKKLEDERDKLKERLAEVEILLEKVKSDAQAAVAERA